MQKAIHDRTVPHCVSETCNGLVKPEIVFFGEQLPKDFFENKHLPSEADLCIVMGTSLSVQPFASLPQFCEERTPRVLINQEQVGGLGSRADDVLVLGDCDDGVRKLAEACGWLEELEAVWGRTAPERQPKTEKERQKKTRDEQLQEEVEQITREVEENLRVSEAQHKWLENHVDNKFARIPTDESSKSGAEEQNSKTGSADSSTAKQEDEKTAQPNHSSKYYGGDGGGDVGGGGLAHVFPFLGKKSSL